MIVLNEIYNNIIEGNKYINNLNNDIEEKKLIKNNVSEILFSAHDEYFPKEIKDYIVTRIKYQIIYRTKINGKQVNVKLYTTKQLHNEEYREIIKKILMAIYTLNLYSSSKCSKNINIDIFFTPFKKKFSKNLNVALGPINVNTGYSTAGCNKVGEITIYREEEWYKVLIHELFHNLNLDFSTMKMDKWREVLHSKLGFNSEFNIYETYCETWARILNVAFIAYIQVTNKKQFIEKFNKLIEVEQLFTLIQCNKILKRIKNPSDYYENSNILCYYVFTAALMNNSEDFIKWCLKNNGDKFLKFSNTIKNVDSFLDLILKEYSSAEFLENLNFADKIKLGKMSNSLRMTL